MGPGLSLLPDPPSCLPPCWPHWSPLRAQGPAHIPVGSWHNEGSQPWLQHTHTLAALARGRSASCCLLPVLINRRATGAGPGSPAWAQGMLRNLRFPAREGQRGRAPTWRWLDCLLPVRRLPTKKTVLGTSAVSGCPGRKRGRQHGQRLSSLWQWVFRMRSSRTWIRGGWAPSRVDRVAPGSGLLG